MINKINCDHVIVQIFSTFPIRVKVSSNIDDRVKLKKPKNSDNT